MHTTFEIEIAEEIIIDCAEDAQESNGGYPNLQDSRFWTRLNGYTNYPDAAKIIEEEFGYAKVEALVREGYMKAQAKIDNENELEDLRLQKAAISNLQELLDYLITEARELPYLDHDFRDDSMFEDWTSDIPTFGGDEPRDTSETWSWDETHLLVGSCGEDLEIIPRTETIYCHRCDTPLNPDKTVWLNQNSQTLLYEFLGCEDCAAALGLP